jgi:hypothetical protein
MLEDKFLAFCTSLHQILDHIVFQVLHSTLPGKKKKKTGEGKKRINKESSSQKRLSKDTETMKIEPELRVVCSWDQN